MNRPKRGRVQGRRRNVVSVSLDDNVLAMLDQLAVWEQDYATRRVTRSRMLQLLISRGHSEVWRKRMQQPPVIPARTENGNTEGGK